jgi:hypothetical protein
MLTFQDQALADKVRAWRDANAMIIRWGSVLSCLIRPGKLAWKWGKSDPNFRSGDFCFVSFLLTYSLWNAGRWQRFHPLHSGSNQIKDGTIVAASVQFVQLSVACSPAAPTFSDSVLGEFLVYGCGMTAFLWFMATHTAVFRTWPMQMFLKLCCLSTVSR